MNEKKILEVIRYSGKVKVKDYRQHLSSLSQDEVEDLYYDYTSRIYARNNGLSHLVASALAGIIISLFALYGYFLRELYLTMYPKNIEYFDLLFSYSIISMILIVLFLVCLYKTFYIIRVNIIRKQKIIEDYLKQKGVR